ncbi:chorismate mutase [Schizosaccharomyces cryophilus OY26]|uniref:Chorismate mutase n=1 Tax=Schizosaccharomyces cryophilus (strain OY26 / ATCC MYA-4695 / CBS 11777 / NBRC 106824 / NRRL Y48691) TaxID=653667 RepID=S9W2N7_SCHCR|nr:chorismate mutase [Schizosaccharomyces cryophilus OY26]EPY52744.1 chorismate mutase [Schizosaccharomyces cryophilus OY26]
MSFVNEKLKLENIRSALIRQEDTIVFDFLERAQFPVNEKVYKKGSEGCLNLQHTDKSFLEYLLHEEEKLYSLVRRYASPEEYPFTSDLPEPILPDFKKPFPLHKNEVNVNNEIFNYYVKEILPKICTKGNDSDNFGSTAVCDIRCLQSLSRRIHYGKFVAEAKFLTNPEKYKKLIEARDSEGIVNEIVDPVQEGRVLKRLHYKALTYGRDSADPSKPTDKINADTVVSIYKEYVIPMTKKVEVDYLLNRLKD